LPPVASLKNITEGVALEGNIDSAIVLDDSGESPYTAPVSMLYPLLLSGVVLRCCRTGQS